MQTSGCSSAYRKSEQGLNAGLGGNYQRSTTNTFSKEEKKENRVELQSHHEEKVKIPPGKKVTVKMTSYRVRYKLQYTMEYKIFKEAYIRVRIDTCGGLGNKRYLTAVLGHKNRDGRAIDAVATWLSRRRGVRLCHTGRRAEVDC